MSSARASTRHGTACAPQPQTVGGCVLIAALLVSLASACAPTRTTKSFGEQIDDSLLMARVKSALAQELGSGDSIRTDVEVFRGRVQLNGFVDTSAKRAEAARIVRAVRGVSAVDNNLRLATSRRSTGEFLDDRVLTARIKMALIDDPTARL